MGELTTEYRIKLGKIFALIGCAGTLFIPFFGIAFLAAGTYFTYKKDNLEMTHLFYINLIGCICSLLILIFTFVTLLN